MAGSTSEDYALSAESVAEWRSCEQVENGTPSTSPSYWDYDDDDDSGAKPSDLYGKFTWKIENFSHSKRELRSNAFEIGGYKWCVLIYPQGCDSSNHLSLFLCVANHDNLLPGWSHFALFTIVVVNKDPKKNKYNDTLHKFCKKEHDWGWKKFMDRTKVMDGFVDDDTLTIKAQVQVIREKALRPFRCLDCQYRRELTRVHLSTVEKTCAHFVDERRQKFQTLIDDKVKWSSFCAFWLGIDQATRRHMSRDKKDDIFKITVKHFFIEKDVSSVLIMDSLYNGLRIIESWSKNRTSRDNLCDNEELPAPIISIENDIFVLVDDVFLLLERASLEFPHSRLSSKEEKALPARSKDGCSEDGSSRDSVQRDERRLTVLGLRALEISVLAHIFSKIKTAYDETVALKRQEELIHEEEEAEQAENERREKREKKKQARQRRKNHKGKDKEKDENSVCIRKEKNQLQEIPSVERICEDFSSQHEQVVNEELKPDLEDIDASPRRWDTDTSETNPTAEACASEISNGHVEKKSSSFVDDSSSTCSTDSIPSVVINGPYKGHSLPKNKKKRNSFNRGKNWQNRDKRNISTLNADQILLEGLHSLKDQIQRIDQQFIEQEKVGMMSGNRTFNKDQIDEDTPSKSRTKELLSSSLSPARKPLPVKHMTQNHTSNSQDQSEKSVSLLLKSPQNLSISKPVAPKHATQNSSISRPSSVPLVSTSQRTRLLSQTQSSGNRLDSGPSLVSPTFEPKSYRNAILGIKTATGASTSKFTLLSLSSPPQSSTTLSHLPSSSSSSSHLSQSHYHANDNVGIGNNCDTAIVSQGLMPDEFPHLDIINDLLDEDRIAGTTTFNPYHYNDDFHSFYQFDLPEYYYYPVLYPEFNGLQPVQLDLSVYGNRMDENLQTQWPMTPDGYGYQLPEYSTCVSRYDMTYQHTNGI